MIGLRAQLEDQQRRKAHALAVMPEGVEALEVVLFEESVGEQAGSELVHQQFPLGHPALAVGVDLDRLGLGAGLATSPAAASARGRRRP